MYEDDGLSKEARALFYFLLGLPYPAISPEYLRDLAGRHRVVAGGLRRLTGVVIAVGRAAMDMFRGGRTREALGKKSAVLLEALDDLALGYDANADSLLKTALNVEYARYMVEGMLAWFLLELTIAIVTLRFDLIPEIFAATRAGLTRILVTLLEHVSTSMTLEVGVAASLDRIIQQLQRSQGHRTGFDHEATHSALVGGALGGALGIPAGLAAEKLAHLLASHLGDSVRTALEQRFKDLAVDDDLAGGLAGEIGTVFSHNERDLLAALSTPTGKPDLPAQEAARLGDAFAHVFVTHFATTTGAGERAALREAGQAYGRALFHALPPQDSRTTAEVFARAWDLPAPATAAVPAGVRKVLNELPGIVRQEMAGSVRWLRSGAGLVSGGALEGAGESVSDLLSNLVLTGQAGTDPFTFVGALFSGIAEPVLTHGADRALDKLKDLKDLAATGTVAATTQPTPTAPATPVLATPVLATGDPATGDPATVAAEDDWSDTDTLAGDDDNDWDDDAATVFGDDEDHTVLTPDGKHDGGDGKKAKAQLSSDDPVAVKTRPGSLHALPAGKAGTGQSAGYLVPPREGVQVQAFMADTTGPLQDGLNNVLNDILESGTPAQLGRFARALTGQGTGPQPTTPTGQTPGPGVTAADHPAPPRTTPTPATTPRTHSEASTRTETGRRTTAGQTAATRPDTATTTAATSDAGQSGRSGDTPAEVSDQEASDTAPGSGQPGEHGRTVSDSGGDLAGREGDEEQQVSSVPTRRNRLFAPFQDTPVEGEPGVPSHDSVNTDGAADAPRHTHGPSEPTAARRFDSKAQSHASPARPPASPTDTGTPSTSRQARPAYPEVDTATHAGRTDTSGPYDDIGTAVAATLHTHPRPDLRTDQQPAWQLSETQRTEFATQATTGLPGGSPRAASSSGTRGGRRPGSDNTDGAAASSSEQSTLSAAGRSGATRRSAPTSSQVTLGPTIKDTAAQNPAAIPAYAEPTMAQLWLSRLNPETRRPEHRQVSHETAESAAVPHARTDTSGDTSHPMTLAGSLASFAHSAHASVLPDGTVSVSDGKLVITTPRLVDESKAIERDPDELGETRKSNLDQVIGQLEYFAQRGLEKLDAEKYQQYIVRARTIMDGRHKIPRLGDDVAANREREILEKIRLIVAHQAFLDDHMGGVHEREKDAVYISEWLRNVFDTKHTDGFMVPAGAIGVEIEFPGWGLIPGPSQSEAQIPNTLLRTSHYSLDAEFPDAGAPYIELVGPPIAVTDGDAERLRKRDFVRAAEDFWSKLHSSVDLPRPSLKSIFPDAHIRSSARDLLVRRVPERPDVLGPQFTIGVPLGSLFAPLSLFHQEIPDDSYMAKLHSATGQKFGTMVAAQFASYAHRDRLPGSMLPELMVDLFTEDADVTAIRGLMYLTYTHVAAQLHWELLAAARVPGTSLAKNLVAVLSRTSIAGIRSESPKKIRRFLDKNRASIRSLFTSFFTSSMRGARHREIAHFLSGGDLLDVPITDAHGATVGDYLDNALLDTPRVLLDQEITFGITHFVWPDVNPDASGRRRLTPSALLELRHYTAVQGMQDVWRTLDNLESVSNYIYQQDERVRSLSSTQEGAASISRNLEGISTIARDAGNNPTVALYFGFLRHVWSLELASLDVSVSGPLLSTVSVLSITDSIRKTAYGGSSDAQNGSVDALVRLKKKLARLENKSGNAESPLRNEIREVSRMASQLVELLGGVSP